METTRFIFNGVREGHPLKGQEGTDVSLGEFLGEISEAIKAELEEVILPFVTLWTPDGQTHYRVHR